jgi:hypothetical protein
VNNRAADRRVLLFALLGVLLIRLVAWGPGVDATVHAGHLNQTIPTPTRPGPAVTPPGGGVQTPGPTRPPSRPSDTATAPPAASVTEPAAGTVTEPVTERTPSPTLVTASPGPGASASATAEAPPSSPAPAATEPLPSVAPTLTGLPLVSGTPTPVPPPLLASTTPAPEGARTLGFWSLSCLWLPLGLILIGAGIAVLLWRRRSG